MGHPRVRGVYHHLIKGNEDRWNQAIGRAVPGDLHLSSVRLVALRAVERHPRVNFTG